MTKKTIVTLSDSNYFPLLEELIHSIRRFKQSENIDICLLDAGLSSDQIELISTQVDEIKKADWDINIPFYKKGKDKLIKNYGIGAQIIKSLHIKNMILVTRSRKKVVGLDGYGIKIVKQEIIK